MNQHTSCPRSWAVNKLYYTLCPAWKSGKGSPDMESKLCSLLSPWLWAGDGAEKSSPLTSHCYWHLAGIKDPQSKVLWGSPLTPDWSDSTFNTSILTSQRNATPASQPSAGGFSLGSVRAVLDVGACTCIWGRAISGVWSTTEISLPTLPLQEQGCGGFHQTCRSAKKTLHSLLGE